MANTSGYRDVEEDYFEKRQLRPYAKSIHLWALGVGAVISGDFFGWNFGLAAGGFGGLLIATIIITVMYIGLCHMQAVPTPLPGPPWVRGVAISPGSQKTWNTS